MADIKKRLSAIKNRILANAAEVAHYDSWDATFSVKNIKEACSASQSVFNKQIEKFYIDDFLSMTPSELIDEGFGNWDDNLFLVPLWLKNFIHDDEILISIGGVNVKIQDTDNDHRGGCIAFGFCIN